MSVSMIEPGWFSERGAARYTGFTDKSIRTAINLGHLPHSKVSIVGTGARPSIRIKREHLDAWIEGREAPSSLKRKLSVTGINDKSEEEAS